MARPPEPPGKEPSARWDKLKSTAILAGVVLASIGAAYGIGYVQGKNKLTEAEAALSAQKLEHEQQASGLRAELSGANRTRARLEARRRIHHALLAMDDRNFGIAHKHLQAAAVLLNQSSPEGALRALTDELTQFKLVATEDFSTQRQRLLDWALRIDELEPLQSP